MPKFTYKGETRGGKSIKKTVEAKDRYAVYDIARKEGDTVTEILDTGGFSIDKFFNVEKIEYFISKISDDELVMMTRNLGSMLKAGLPLTRAFEVIEKQSKNPRLKGTIKDVRKRINKGGQLYEALGAYPKVFNELYVACLLYTSPSPRD